MQSLLVQLLECLGHGQLVPRLLCIPVWTGDFALGFPLKFPCQLVELARGRLELPWLGCAFRGIALHHLRDFAQLLRQAFLEVLQRPTILGQGVFSALRCLFRLLFRLLYPVLQLRHLTLGLCGITGRECLLELFQVLIRRVQRVVYLLALRILVQGFACQGCFLQLVQLVCEGFQVFPDIGRRSIRQVFPQGGEYLGGLLACIRNFIAQGFQLVLSVHTGKAIDHFLHPVGVFRFDGLVEDLGRKLQVGLMGQVLGFLHRGLVQCVAHLLNRFPILFPVVQFQLAREGGHLILPALQASPDLLDQAIDPGVVARLAIQLVLQGVQLVREAV